MIHKNMLPYLMQCGGVGSTVALQQGDSGFKFLVFSLPHTVQRHVRQIALSLSIASMNVCVHIWMVFLCVSVLPCDGSATSPGSSLPLIQCVLELVTTHPPQPYKDKQVSKSVLLLIFILLKSTLKKKKTVNTPFLCKRSQEINILLFVVLAHICNVSQTHRQCFCLKSRCLIKTLTIYCTTIQAKEKKSSYIHYLLNLEHVPTHQFNDSFQICVVVQMHTLIFFLFQRSKFNLTKKKT